MRRTAKMKVIDLTATLRHGMRGVTFETSDVLETSGWNARLLHLYSHAGTHMDSPFHFGVNDTTIDRIPVERFIADAWVVDVPVVADSMEIGIEHLKDIGGRVSAGDGLLFRTGWHRFADADNYRTALPWIGRQLANWCVEKNVKLIGVEPLSVTIVTNREELQAVHRILLGGDVILVEGLGNLEAIRKPKVKVIALPLKIEGGDGAPARVIAIEE
jgi:kynurenine formamidase